MKSYSLSHLSDETLLRDLASLVARDRATTAALLAHVAEVDARRLYVPAAYPSMYSYCVQELRLSADSACKRLRAARIARQFPVIFTAVAEGRLSLSAVVMLAPHLTPENADELLTAAAHKSKSEIEGLLAERFPRPDLPARVGALSPTPSPAAGGQALPTEPLAPGPVEPSAPGRIEPFDLTPRVAPLSPQRFALQLTMGQGMYDDLCYAQELLSHQIPSGDVTQVLHRALRALIGQLESRKFAATGKPRRHPQRPTSGGRHVPAHVKRAVWERDGGRCTFVSETGRRCPARTLLEFDHIDEVARGGQASVGRIRLRCRAHNQYGAERTFGAEFMRHKRQAARHAAATPARAVAQEQATEVIPWLRALGFRADEARRAAALCETIPDAPLEQRVRLALTCFRPNLLPGRVGSAWAGP